MLPTEYIHHGGVYCPVCHSTNIDAERIEPVDYMKATSRVTCFSCDSIWLDMYNLTDIEILKRGKQ